MTAVLDIIFQVLPDECIPNLLGMKEITSGKNH
jgi:hypothetical protein